MISLDYFSLFENLLKDDGILSIITLFHDKDDEVFKTTALSMAKPGNV